MRPRRLGSVARWLCAGLMCAAATARADTANDALALLDQGINLFQAGKLEAARDAFVRARDLVPDKPNPHRWLGLVYARMGQCSQATWELESFIRRVPPNDPRTVEAVTLRDRCRVEMRQRFGALAVESTPPGAQVRLDDAAAAVVGTTPYRNEAITVGNHLVFLHKDGFAQAAKGVAIQDQGTTHVALTLEPEAVAAASTTTTPVAEKPKSRAWIWGVVAGGAVVLALGVGLGVGLGTSSSGPTTLPAVRGGM